ncbi:exocyst complex component 3-like protein 4 [Thalassophryne amazonica]|uniref:exocyst complex component 3-like protein 4 n=1 Tax=Thalassophryne amazonica TaxID=390379 RepID=UPI001471B275|nr:exocyst complex component 3-like protein 4 [Thalassophryne amazonica]XP_034051402.1 exocyst complex component 3-like protein 4 [Thalassophryne amazonica]
MAQMSEGSTENPDEDSVPLRSNGKTSTNGSGKEKLGLLKTFRHSIKRVGEKSPISSMRSKVTTTEGTGAADTNGSSATDLETPTSPSLNAGSPIVSPLKSIGVFFQKKAEAGSEGTSTKIKSPLRTRSDPTALFGDSLLKKGASIGHSLRLSSKKDKERICTEDPLIPENKEEEMQGEVMLEKMWESYALPEIPDTPLSVMQISKLIEMEVLEEAHLNLLSLRQEFQREREQCTKEDSPVELAKKEKDLSLLYENLRNKIKAIVRDSNSLPNRNNGLLEPVAHIILEEEKRAGEPCALAGSWMESWREAVGEGVQAKVENIHLDSMEQNTSWLAVHLGLLGKVIVQDLENVKKDLQWSYPPSFKAFSVYVKSYHKAIGQHLKKLQQQVTERKDYYRLLDWINNCYQSEKIMGSVSLQPEMKSESTDLHLEDGFLEHLKEQYSCKIKEDMQASLDKISELENEKFWSEKKPPDIDNNFLNSQIHMDIWTIVEGNAVNTRALDAQLEQKVICSCLEALKEFPSRFMTEFKHHCDTEPSNPLWTQYHITYINSFTDLQNHMEGYRDSCPHQVEEFSREVKQLINDLCHCLKEHFKEDVKPYLRRMMTRTWLTNNSDFQQLHSRTKRLSEDCALMKPPHVQEFVSQLHYHVVRGYISQLMKNDYSCKNRKHEEAASKIRGQWGELRDLFEDMNSSHEWLHPVGDDLSDIIGQKNKRDIKNHLQPVVEHYPDFSRKHLAAVLFFRGVTRGREHQLILRKLTELKKSQSNSDGSDRSRVLFGDMQANVNTNCLSKLPLSCLGF